MHQFTKFRLACDWPDAANMLKAHIQFALRMLRKSPAFTTAAVATLALGIGANTAVFSVVDGVMLQPLPYTDPSRLVSLWETNDQRPRRSTVAPANLVDYIRANRTFDGLAGYASSSKSLTRAGTPEQLLGEATTWNLFQVLGVSPAIGRPFLPEEDRPGQEHVVILSDALWRGRFAGDPAILGRSIMLNGQPYDVVGVMPPSFQPLTQIGSAVPVVFFVPAAYPDELLANHGDHEINVVGRLRKGVRLQQAQADLDGISLDLAKRFPDTNLSEGLVRTRLAPLNDDIVRGVRTSLLVMLGAVGLVLLIGCVNVANLLIVRAMGQRQDTAIRIALGASRTQIAADMITRAIVLGLLGGAAGLLCGMWTRDALVSMAPASVPRLDRLAVNPRVLFVTMTLSLFTGLLAGLLPALQTSRCDVTPALKSTGHGISSERSMMRWRGVLMAAEIAAALMLAVGAGLLVRSLIRLNSIDLGFETDRVLTAYVRLPEAKYPDQRARASFFAELSARVRPIPGVRHVAFANQFPMRGGWGGGFTMKGPAGEIRADADFQAVSPDYFATLGIPLIRGRLLADADRDGTLRVAVVSQTFVRRFLGDRDPIGRQFGRGDDSPPVTIVGVVGEVRRDGKAAEITPQVYLSAAQTDMYPVRLASLAVRSLGDPYALVPAIQRAVWSIDPDQPITGVRTLDEVLSIASAQRRFNMTLLLSFAGLALVLALMGVYGVIAYAVAQRTREIGIRVALGATRADVVTLVLKSGLAWSIVGVAAGLTGAYAASRSMSGMLFGVTADDPPTFATMALLMIGVALSACYVPARRASSVDPVSALRAD
jgi:putative ABC transport system permease protein